MGARSEIKTSTPVQFIVLVSDLENEGEREREIDGMRERGRERTGEREREKSE